MDFTTRPDFQERFAELVARDQRLSCSICRG
jgi:hypothetical protein